MLDEAVDRLDRSGSDTALPERSYVNHVSFRFTLSEVCIDLGQEFPGAKGAITCSRLVTNPAHLVHARGAIDAAISRYESRFGSIPAACPSRGGDDG